MDPFFKQWLKSVTRAFGINLRAKSGRRSMKQFVGFLARRGFRPGTIIDVGVADGTIDLYRAFPAAELLLIEPMLQFAGPIAAILRKRKGHYFAGAAATQAGEMMIYSAPGVAAAHNAAFAPKGPDWVGRTLPIERVDTLVEKFGLKSPYLIKVDVEGFELSVVQGCTAILQQAPVVILEVGLMPSNERRPFAEVVTTMAGLGYVVFDLFDGLLRPFDEALSICDVAFVHEKGEFRTSMQWHSEPPSLIGRAAGGLRGAMGV